MSEVIHHTPTGAVERSDAGVHVSDPPTAMSVEETRRMLKAFPIEIPDSIRSRVDKSDLVQDVLLKIAEKDYGLEAMKPQEQRAFLRKMLSSRVVDVIRNHCSFKRDIRRDRPLESDPLGSESTPSSILVGKEDQSDLESALHQLPADYQTVLRLRHREGLTFVQIGEIMGRSPQAARVLWGRAVLRLTRRLSS